LEDAFKVGLAESKVSVSGVSSLFWSNSVIWGWDLRFLRTKKPARVADKNIRISLRGHILKFDVLEESMWLWLWGVVDKMECEVGEMMEY
jgi:hypothetical protein